jgi:hypothetical protein
MSFSHASNGPDFDTDLSIYDVDLLRLIASPHGKFDLALSHGLVEKATALSQFKSGLGGPPLSSQSLAAHAPWSSAAVWLALLWHFECSSVARFKYDDTLEVAQAALWLPWSPVDFVE